MIQVTAMYLDGAKIGEGVRKCTTDTDTPVFSWAVKSDKRNDCQKSCRVTVFDDKRLYWDSGIVKKSEQSLKYAGEKLPHGTRIDVSVTVTGFAGEESPEYITSFVDGVLDESEIHGKWITSAEPNNTRAIYFRRDFDLSSDVASACLYTAGYGYHILR